MKNGTEKRIFILNLINEKIEGQKTILEIFETTKPFFILERAEIKNGKVKRVTENVNITLSSFRFIISRLIADKSIKAVKKILPQTGSKAPVYLISKLKTKTQ